MVHIEYIKHLSSKVLRNEQKTERKGAVNHFYGPNDYDYIHILGVPYISANINCKSRNLPNTDMRNYSTDLR